MLEATTLRSQDSRAHENGHAGTERIVHSKTIPSVKVWIDLDNTPHVPFFIPVMRELKRRGHQVVLTARDAFQVCELAAQKGLQCEKVGRHYGKSSLMKVAG